MRSTTDSGASRRRAWRYVPALAAVPLPAYAHAPEWAGAWAFDPLAAVLLALSGLAYARGQWRLARRAGGRDATLFWLGWASLAVALGPPLEKWSAVSFAAHMVQHEIIMLAAAPLLVASRPFGVILWGLPSPAARALAALPRAVPLRGVWGWLTAPWQAWTVHAVVLWFWHLPAAFEAGLASDAVHWLQHASFFLAALLFWQSLGLTDRSGWRRGAALLSVFTTALHTGMLGALLSFSGRLWYPSYAHAVPPWSLSALEDQRLGGLIMWVPGGAVFFAAGLVLVAGWLAAARN